MEGCFGVFDGIYLVGGTFGDDADADRYRRDLLQDEFPEHLRRSQYDAADLEVREVPENYDQWIHLLERLHESRNHDLTKERLQRVIEEHHSATT
jgi:hypothetical protein